MAVERKTIKWTVLFAVIGVILGGLAGFGFRVLSESTLPEELPEFDTLQEYVDARPLQARCVRGEELSVVLHWSLPEDVQRNELFRSTDGAAPVLIPGAGGKDATLNVFIDTSVESGKTYTYHYETDENIKSNEYEIRVSPENCISPQ